MHLTEDNSNDIYKIIELQNDVKIGICSYGDDDFSNEILKEFAKQECKVIVCTSRTKGTSVDSINLLIEELKNEIKELKKEMNTYQIKWIHKSYLWNEHTHFEEEMLNDSFSESILKLVEYYMVL